MATAKGPFRSDDWLLLRHHGTVLAHGRAYGRGDVLTTEGTHGLIIHAVTRAAAGRGARTGARLTDARALDPGLVAVPADPQGDQALLEGQRLESIRDRTLERLEQLGLKGGLKTGPCTRNPPSPRGRLRFAVPARHGLAGAGDGAVPYSACRAASLPSVWLKVTLGSTDSHLPLAGS